MGRHDKLVAKLLDGKQAMTWKELTVLLARMGYKEIQGDGSRVKFDNGNPDHTINLHRLHPDKHMKRYAVKLVRDKLTRAKLL